MTGTSKQLNQTTATRQGLSLKSVLLTCLALAAITVSGCAAQRDRLSNVIGERVVVPDNKKSFMKRWYAGASLGGSNLDPDLSNVGFSLKKGSSVGSQMRIGYDLHNLMSLEFDTAVLGTAEMEATAEVEYTSFAASGLLYGLTGNSNRSRRQDWSAFMRLGYGQSSVASNVQVIDGKDLSGAIFGLGVEYGMPNGIGLRMEATRYHDEASFVGLGAIYRFGSKEKGHPVIFAKKATMESQSDYTAGESGVATAARVSRPDEPPVQAGLPGVLQQGKAPAVDVSTTRRLPANQSQNYIQKVVVATVKDLDGDGVSNDADECANTRPGTSVDYQGCGLFDGVVEGLSFENGSARLGPTTKRILDRLAVRLSAFPEVRVEVQAHTDAKGPDSINQSVSETRANAVVRYLIRQGVSREQLEASGKGETRLLNTEDTEYARIANRRIELETLPDLDIVPKHVTVLAPTARRQQFNASAGQAVAALASSSKAKSKNIPGVKTAAAMQKVQTSAKDEPSLGAATAKSTVDVFVPAPVDVPGASLNGQLEGVSFEGRTDKFGASTASALQTLATELKSYSTTRVAIMVHTDDLGSDKEDLDLSMKQATAISKFLIGQGIEQARLELEGYGSNLPVSQNVSEADRALNRRVELRVLAQ